MACGCRAVSITASEPAIKQDLSKGSPLPMTCADGRYAEYLADVIKRAVALAAAELHRRDGGVRSAEYML